VLSTSNAPTLNSVTFKLTEREVGKAVEGTAKSSCQNCLTKEKNEALPGRVTVDDGNLALVACYFNMGWQRHGKGHNSRIGQAAVMSLSSGKVLDYTTRTKSCRFCDWAKSTGKQPKVHDCRKNYVASSKAMEPDAAVELFNRAPTQAVKFSIYTGDDGSTTEAHIRQKVAYRVEKFRYIIHMNRSLTTRLYNLSQNAKFDNCSPLSQKVINHLVKCFSYAISQNKGDSKEKRWHLGVSFHMYLETILTVRLLNVGSKLTQRPTSIKTCPMEKIFMGKSCCQLWITSSKITALML